MFVTSYVEILLLIYCIIYLTYQSFLISLLMKEQFNSQYILVWQRVIKLNPLPDNNISSICWNFHLVTSYRFIAHPVIRKDLSPWMKWQLDDETVDNISHYQHFCLAGFLSPILYMLNKKHTKVLISMWARMRFFILIGLTSLIWLSSEAVELYSKKHKRYPCCPIW